jgi:excisionase family DNA binding protein
MTLLRKPLGRVAPQTELPRLLTAEQAAEIMAVKPVTVRSWLTSGRLPRVKLGRCVRVPASAVAEFIAANTFPATS